jgi:hypothetical protein
VQSRRTRVRHPRLRSHFKNTDPKLRYIYRIAYLGDQYQFGLHHSSAANLERGLAERVFMVKNYNKNYDADLDPEFCPPPKPEVGIFQRHLTKYSKEIIQRVGRRSPISYEKFLSYYTGGKLTTYSRAVDSLTERPVNKADAKLSTFVKAEKLNLSLKSDPVPRVIQPRHPRYNVEVGRYLKPIEHDIYTAIDGLFGSKTIFKGLSVEAMGSLIHQKMRKFLRPCAIGFDASRFDQHVSVDALKYEHSIYKGIYSHSKTLNTLLKWQIHNKGVAIAKDGFFRYSVDGCRMSGDMNTSLGNCILAALISKDFIDRFNLDAELINNGDDNVLICSEDDEEVVKRHLYDHWLKYGFEVVAEEPVYITEQVEFCQMKPVFDGTNYVMVRKPDVSMSKDCHSITPFYTTKTAKKWVHAVGECGLSLTGGIPIKQEYYTCMIRNGDQHGEIDKSKEFISGFTRLSKCSNRKYRQISSETRYSFYLAFGYTPDEQVAIENYFRTLELPWHYGLSGTPARAPECLLLTTIPQPPTFNKSTPQRSHEPSDNQAGNNSRTAPAEQWDRGLTVLRTLRLPIS